MDDKREKSRWEKSLSEAGLLDDNEGDWSLPEGPVDGSTIEVRSPKADEADGEGTRNSDVTAPFKIESLDDETPADVPRTPIERRSTPPLEKENVLTSLGEMPDVRDPSAEIQSDTWADIIPDEEARTSAAPTSGRDPAKITVPQLGDETGDDQILANESVDAPNTGPTTQPEVPLPLGEGPFQDPSAVRMASSKRIFTKKEIPQRRVEMKERFEMGDYSGALDIAEMLLDHDPEDPQGKSYLNKCREILLEMYESRIGSFERVPQLAIEEQEVIWRKLDPQDSFVLSRIDGLMTFGDILDISGLPRFETCRILDQLLQNGIIK